jgi:hypothetical protein
MSFRDLISLRRQTGRSSRLIQEANGLMVRNPEMRIAIILNDYKTMQDVQMRYTLSGQIDFYTKSQFDFWSWTIQGQTYDRIMVDHRVIETKFAQVLEELYRYDRPVVVEHNDTYTPAQTEAMIPINGDIPVQLRPELVGQTLFNGPQIVLDMGSVAFKKPPVEIGTIVSVSGAVDVFDTAKVLFNEGLTAQSIIHGPMVQYLCIGWAWNMVSNVPFGEPYIMVNPDTAMESA